MKELQDRVAEWIKRCFGFEILYSQEERALRIFEEATEFAQAVNANPDQLRDIIQYVYARPIGDPKQELAGVAVCALAAAEALGTQLEAVTLTEVKRIEAKPVEHFKNRRKEKTKAGVTT